MAINTLNTRIQLKYDSLTNWQSSVFNGNDSSKYLKAGEVAIVTLAPNKETNPTATANQHPLLFKVGTGAHKFDDLPWTSALAADVYEWAKENELKFSKAGTGNVVSGIEWDATLNGGKGGIKFTTASVATSEGFEQLQEDVDAIEKDIADNRAAWEKDDNTTYTFAKSTDGKGITITPSEGNGSTISFAFLTQAEIEALNYLVKADITTGSANGTIAVEGADVAVKGLQDAAYTTVSALNATAKGYADAVEAKIPNELGVMSIAKGDDTITIGGTAANPTIAVTANKFDAYGAAAQALQDAKDYADAKPHENTAHTHTTGDGLKQTGNGGIDGNVLTELNLAFVEDKTNKLLKLVDATDNTKVVASFDTTEFIADGMLASVTPDTANNKLVFEWNTTAGITKTEIEFDQIADIYTGSTGSEVQVAISNQNVVSATLVEVPESKLEDKTQTALGLARTALQSHQDITGKADKKVPAAVGNIATLDATGNLADSGKKVTDFDAAGAAEAVQTAITTGTAIAKKAEQDADGNVISTTYAKSADLGELAYKTVIDPYTDISGFDTAVVNAMGTDQGYIDLNSEVANLKTSKLDKTATVNGHSFGNDGSVTITTDDFYFNHIEQDYTLTQYLSDLDSGKMSIDATASDIAFSVDITGNSTSIKTAIEDRQTEAQVNALIAAALNSITTINCGSSTEVI